MIRLRTLNTCIVLFIGTTCFGQGLALEDWRDHLPYAETHSVAASSSRVYCAAKSSLFYFDKNDNTINRITTKNGLSDVELGPIEFNWLTQTLLITYKNGNIDLLKSNGEIINVSFIKNSDIIGNKEIFRIDMEDEFAYLSTGLGIVVFNTSREEIKDTYFVGTDLGLLEVFDVQLTPDTIFAATEAGLFKGLRTANLADYRAWKRETRLKAYPYNLILQAGDMMLLNHTVANDTLPDSVYTRKVGVWENLGNIGDTAQADKNFDLFLHDDEIVVPRFYSISIYDLNFNLKDVIFTYNFQASPQARNITHSGDKYWAADELSGLVAFSDNYHADVYKINSPLTDRVFDLDFLDGDLWSVPGSQTPSYNNQFVQPVLSRRSDDEWLNIDRLLDSTLNSFYDIVDVAIDPFNKEHVFMASWGAGLIELENGEITRTYTIDNQFDHSLGFRSVDSAVFVGGIDFDENGNLWMSNPYNSNLISVLTNEGEWRAINLQGAFNADAAFTQVLADSEDRVWVLQPRDNRILVYKNNYTPTDVFDDPPPVLLRNSSGSGDLPGDQVLSIVEDLNGEIWIGTNEGIGVIYSPSAIFNDGNYDAQRILLQQDGTTQILLENEGVTAMAVDGANRKWIGTRNAGVFLMSEDGTEEILHFTTENSPLFSDFIRCITIDNTTGEVFFGTDAGLISYRGTATAGNEEIDEVEVFPNPVKPDYNGRVAINGLVDGAVVKITDAAGILVYETRSLGGQAIWNVKNFNGQRVSTGVYLIFSTNADGEQTNVSKVMVLN